MRPIDRVLDNTLFALLAIFAGSLTVGIALTQITLALAILVWFACCLSRHRWLGFATPLDKWIGLFLVACLLATVFSVRPLDSAIALKKFYLITPVYLLAYAVKDLRQVRLLVAMFLSGAALTATWGLVKYARHVDHRLLGTQPTAMHSGGIYMMAALLALALLAGAVARRERSWGWYAAVVSAVILAGLVFTKTISAWFGWLAGMSALVWKHRWVIAAITGAFAAILAVIIVVHPSEAWIFFTGSKPASLQIRLDLWRMGWHLFQQRPITGFGMISLQDQYRDIPYDNPFWGVAMSTGHLHNNFIQLAVTAGVVGLSAFVLMWIAIFNMLAGTLSGSDPASRPYALGFLACAAGFMVNGLAEYNFGASVQVTIIWFMIGLALALRRMNAPGHA